MWLGALGPGRMPSRLHSTRVQSLHIRPFTAASRDCAESALPRLRTHAIRIGEHSNSPLALPRTVPDRDRIPDSRPISHPRESPQIAVWR